MCVCYVYTVNCTACVRTPYRVLYAQDRHRSIFTSGTAEETSHASTLDRPSLPLLGEHHATSVKSIGVGPLHPVRTSVPRRDGGRGGSLALGGGKQAARQAGTPIPIVKVASHSCALTHSPTPASPPPAPASRATDGPRTDTISSACLSVSECDCL